MVECGGLPKKGLQRLRADASVPGAVAVRATTYNTSKKYGLRRSSSNSEASGRAVTAAPKSGGKGLRRGSPRGGVISGAVAVVVPKPKGKGLRRDRPATTTCADRATLDPNGSKSEPEIALEPSRGEGEDLFNEYRYPNLVPNIAEAERTPQPASRPGDVFTSPVVHAESAEATNWHLEESAAPPESPGLTLDEQLISAQVVDEEALVADALQRRSDQIRNSIIEEAVVATEVKQETFWKKHKVSILLCCLLSVIIVIVLAVSLPNGTTTSLAGYDYLVELLSPVSGQDVLLDEATPQNEALNWLAFEDKSNIPQEESMARTLTERYVIALFFFAMGGADWTSELSFLNNSSVCEWPAIGEDESRFLNGVRCDNLGNVNYLHLESNNITGSILEEIGALESLQSVSMRHNHINGLLPASLGALPRLEDLDFSFNGITGSIPASLSDLETIEVLRLHNNRITGTIPLSLTRIAGLEDLALFNNLISGHIPDFLGRSALRLLDLHDNMLEGSIPESLYSLYKMEDIRLGSNALTGTLSTRIGLLRRLKEVRLDNNKFMGTLPSHLGDLVDLTWLLLQSNSYSGNLPSELGILGKLLDLWVAENQLTGTIPEALSQVTSLEFLSLEGNFLTGTVPPELAALHGLSSGFIGLHNNSLNGTLGNSFCNEDLFAPPSTVTADCNELECPCCTDCCDDATGECVVQVDKICQLYAGDFDSLGASVNTSCSCQNGGFDLTCQAKSCQACNPEGTACIGNYDYGIDFSPDGFDNLWRCNMQHSGNKTAGGGIRNETVTYRVDWITDGCSVEVDGVPCHSCSARPCSDGAGGYRVDCSNIEAGAIYDDCEGSLDGGDLLWFLKPQYWSQECFPCYADKNTKHSR